VNARGGPGLVVGDRAIWADRDGTPVRFESSEALKRPPGKTFRGPDQQAGHRPRSSMHVQGWIDSSRAAEIHDDGAPAGGVAADSANVIH